MRRPLTIVGGGARARQRALVLTIAVLLVLGPLASTTRPVLAQNDPDELNGLSATIARSEDGVNLRAEPGFAGEVVGTLADGTVVALRVDEADTVLDEDGETRWWPVRVDGEAGWVAGYYLDDESEATESTETAEADEEKDSADSSSDDAISGATTGARISSEDGANLRAEPGAAGDVLAILPFDASVELRTDEADTVVRGGVRWWPVRAEGQDGWVAGDYLADGAGVVVDDDAADEAVAVARFFALGEYVAAATGTGEGLNVRAGAGIENERVGVVREGDVLQVMDGPIAAGQSASGWYLVTDGDVTGFADGDFLTGADQPPAPAADADPVVPEPVLDPVFFTAGDFAAADGGGVNVRSDASRGSGVLTTLSGGEVVEVIGGPEYDGDGAGWYLVTDGSTTGYANGNFLSAGAAPAPPPPPAPAAPAAGTATGAFIPPLAGYVFTQGYGCSPFVFEPYDANIGCNFHNGIDLAADAYTQLYAADGGVVKYAGWCDCGLGFFVEIDHGNGFATVYGHMLDQPAVVAGQAVARGEPIGLVGSTGLSTGPHVHFMIKVNGSTVDPLLYVSV